MRQQQDFSGNKSSRLQQLARGWGGSGSPAQAAQRVLLLLRRALWYQNKSVLQHAIERKLGEGRTSLSLVEKIHLGPFKFHILVAEGSSGTRL